MVDIIINSGSIEIEESASVLKQRTIEASLPITGIDHDIEGNYFLFFAINSDNYAVSANELKAVIDDFKIVEVPDVPAFILGITDHRSKILAIFDYLRFIGETTTKVTPKTKLIHLEKDNISCGMLVSTIFDFRNISSVQIETGLCTVESSSTEYVNGTIRLKNVTYAIIDIEKILKSDKISNLHSKSE